MSDVPRSMLRIVRQRLVGRMTIERLVRHHLFEFPLGRGFRPAIRHAHRCKKHSRVGGGRVGGRRREYCPNEPELEMEKELSQWVDQAADIAASGRWAAANARIENLVRTPGANDAWWVQVILSLCYQVFSEYHCCPAITRTGSTGYRYRVNRSGSRNARRPVKWAFFQKGLR